MDGHRTAERRSVAYHRAIAERLATDPRVLADARKRVDAWCESGAVHATYATAWRDLLQRPLPELVTLLVDESEHMTRLRQVSPFAGALDPRTRWQIARSVA